jgi:uncharacterized cupredoxin-like copper-binding protein
MARRAVGALSLAAAVLALAGSACGGRSTEATVAIHYSRFAPEVVTVPAGKPVTITLRNDDPIEHEWIVGSARVHERHRTGTEPYHASIPTEVTIPPLATRVTTVTFAEPGEYAYICHLPGHEAYGMVGTLRVVES